MPNDSPTRGIVLVDHGSRLAESNDLLLQVADMYRRESGETIVEPAHMELAEPSIATAFDRCVQQGAQLVIVFPYLLAPGRHWSDDIPRLAAEVASNHPGVQHIVTAPIGLHAHMAQIVSDRINACLNHHLAGTPTCDLCRGEARCKLR